MGEAETKAARAPRVRLESDTDWWRICAQELLASDPAASSSISSPPGTAADTSDGPSVKIQADTARLVAQAVSLRTTCADLHARLPEVERVAAVAQQELDELQQSNQELARSSAHAEASSAEATQCTQNHLSSKASLLEEASSQRVALTNSIRVTAGVPVRAISVDDGTENKRLQRKVEEKQRELTALRSQNSRLRASLAHHEDLEGQKAATSATTTNTTLQSGVAKPLDAFDEFADWASMMLFKSLLVRRFFCVHLAVLYSWLLFLLWWLSSD